jgi:hypothetical protein
VGENSRAPEKAILLLLHGEMTPENERILGLKKSQKNLTSRDIFLLILYLTVGRMQGSVFAQIDFL